MNVLILSVHPDDEALGCGGTILKHRAAGDEVHWLIATQGTEPQWSADIIALKSEEVARVAEAYGMQTVTKLGLPAARLDTLPHADVMAGLGKVLASVRPHTVYLVHWGDIHTDHHAFFTAAMSVMKPFYMRRDGLHRVLCYETLSSTEAAPPLMHRHFAPNVHSDITPFIDRKIEIMDLYASERHPDPMPRGPSAIRALARYRGAAISVDYAEAFVLVREVN
jgi:LmbE family N-acetylglucosaminyl deacetylase